VVIAMDVGIPIWPKIDTLSWPPRRLNPTALDLLELVSIRSTGRPRTACWEARGCSITWRPRRNRAPPLRSSWVAQGCWYGYRRTCWQDHWLLALGPLCPEVVRQGRVPAAGL